MPTPERLTLPDVDAYVTIRRRMLIDSPWSFGSSPDHDPAGQPDNVRAALQDPDRAIFAVRHPSRPRELVSCATLVRETRPKRRHVALVVGVFVDPSFRRKGLGRATVAACIAHARTWPGLTRVELAVSARAPGAKRVYESLGFVTWGCQPDALGIAGEYTDEYYLSIDLTLPPTN